MRPINDIDRPDLLALKQPVSPGWKTVHLHRHAALPELRLWGAKDRRGNLGAAGIQKIRSHLGLDPQPPPRGQVRETGQDWEAA